MSTKLSLQVCSVPDYPIGGIPFGVSELTLIGLISPNYLAIGENGNPQIWYVGTHRSILRTIMIVEPCHHQLGESVGVIIIKSVWRAKSMWGQIDIRCRYR